MAFKGLTMNTPASEAAHIYAEDHAAMYKCIVGDGNKLLNYGENFEVTIAGSNKIRVGSGLLSIQGHFGTIPINDHQDFTLTEGTSGETRTDLLVATFETSGLHGTDEFKLEILEGTSQYVSGTLDDGATKVQMPLYSILTDGVALSSVTRIAKAYPTSLDSVYPIGSIYLSANSTSPAELFGGTWEQIRDRFLLASGEAYTAGSIGGEATHTLTADEMPSHTHTATTASGGGSHTHPVTVRSDGASASGTKERIGNSSATTTVAAIKSSGAHGHSITVGNAGSGTSHNNMPPYLAVYMWKRTA